MTPAISISAYLVVMIFLNPLANIIGTVGMGEFGGIGGGTCGGGG